MSPTLGTNILNIQDEYPQGSVQLSSTLGIFLQKGIFLFFVLVFRYL